MTDPARRWRILIVDDDFHVQEMVRLCLEGQGFLVSSTYSGEECLEYTAKQPVDLILLDVQLPGLSGFEVCKRLRAQTDISSPSIIMLTALTAVRDKVTGLEVGADDYLTKPFEVTELLARVRAQLRLRELQEKLLEAEKRAIIGQMAITLSDKINNPLTSIIWQARLLQEDLKATANVPSRLLAALEGMISDAYRIEQVVKQLHRIKKLSLTSYDGHTTMVDLDKSVAPPEEGDQ